MHADLREALLKKFSSVYRREPTILAYAPGRVEVLGNHTDYNEGLVLSAAIDRGTGFALAPRDDTQCRLTAGDLMHTVDFDREQPAPRKEDTWANYVIGVLDGLNARTDRRMGFEALFFSNVPLGAGLSSSAALEMSAAIALTQYDDVRLDRIELARIGQTAEHSFAGVKCGLLDQVTSLYGQADALVMTDFRSLDVITRPIGSEVCLLLCNTHARHALVDGAYNERRADCETAVAAFDRLLEHPVRALRDVSWAEWEAHHDSLEARVARRAAHPIGETERVAAAVALLEQGDLAGFGKLMFASHASSRKYFKNSCAELDAIVETAAKLPGVLGARLSGGGFGGSAVILLHPRDAETAAAAIRNAYQRRFGQACDTRVMQCADGAGLILPSGLSK